VNLKDTCVIRPKEEKGLEGTKGYCFRANTSPLIVTLKTVEEEPAKKKTSERGDTHVSTRPRKHNNTQV
jgi:hypothetical protein